MDFKALLQAKDFNELVTESRNRLFSRQSKITNWNIGGAFRTLTELAMQGVAELYGLLVKVAPQGFVQFATGMWLDYHARNVGIARLQPTKTVGAVRFSRGSAGQAVRIPAGVILKTDMDAKGNQLRFFTAEERILDKDALSIDVPVRAEFEGAAYNVGEGYIKNIVTHVPGVEAVTNPAGWIDREGSDQEDDASLRDRYDLRWAELGSGAPARAYISWARGIDGVVDADCDDRFPRGPGTVDVIIASSAGAPTPALLAAVAAYIDTKRPNCSDVLVRPAELVTVDHEIVLYAPRNVGDDAGLIAEARAIVQAMFLKDAARAIEPYRIGGDVIVNRCIAYLMQIDNVANVRLIQPAADVSIGRGCLAVLGSVAVRVERVDAP